MSEEHGSAATTVTGTSTPQRGTDALLWVTESCTACGAPTWFDAQAGDLACKHCGSRKSIPVEQVPAPHALDPETTYNLPAPAPAPTAVSCPACNNRIEVRAAMSVRCPACDAGLRRSDLAAGPHGDPIDGIVLFTVSESEAKEAIRRWMRRRWSAPRAFRRMVHDGSGTATYLPFVCYSANADGDYDGERIDRDIESGKHTETRQTVSGTYAVRLNDVATPASAEVANALTSQVSWPVDEAVAFRPEYLVGTLSHSPETSVGANFNRRGKDELDDLVDGHVRRKIGGDDQVFTTSTSYTDLTYRLLLLPVYLSLIAFDGSSYRIVVNGLTGEVQGQSPEHSKKAKRALGLAIMAMFAVAVVLAALLLGGG